jgi:hypothetical protein
MRSAAHSASIDSGLWPAARARARARALGHATRRPTPLEAAGRGLLSARWAKRVRWVGLRLGPHAPVREVGQVEVAQQHGAGQQRGGWVGNAAAGDVLGHVPRALLKYRALVAHVYARQDARPARQARHLRARGRSARRPCAEW